MLRLKSLKSIKQSKEVNSKFHTGTHGWIYNKLKDSKFGELYKDKTNKLFCFSNLFPPPKEEVLRENKIFFLTISSPIQEFIQALFFRLILNEKINLGEYQFELIDFSVLQPFGISNFSVFRTATIINITERTESGYKALDFETEPKKYTRALARNILKKYILVKKKDPFIKEDQLFNNCKINLIEKKKLFIKLTHYKNEKQESFDVIGNQVEVRFGALNKKQKDIFYTAVQCGFGERTSYGFGYIYPITPSGVEDLKDFEELYLNKQVKKDGGL